MVSLSSFALRCIAALTVLVATTQAQTTIMCMGDSITIGVDYFTNTSGGYRNFLQQDLAAAGVNFTFVGAVTNGTTPTLIAAGDTHHKRIRLLGDPRPQRKSGRRRRPLER